MRSKKRPKGSADIAEVCVRVDRWRATRTKRSPMPAPLWDAARRLAQRHGIYPIARRLRVNYESLKDRVGGGASASERSTATRSAAPFVELRPPTRLAGASPPPPGPSVELVDARGATLTIRLGIGARLDVAGLARAFWTRRA